MKSNDIAWLALAVLAGGALGAFFFGGLWWTVRAVVDGPRGFVLQSASLLGRMSVTLLGFHFVGGDQIGRLLACLAGFLIARLLVARWVRQQAGMATTLAEACHADRT